MFKITEYFSFYVLLWYFLYMLNIIPFNPIISFYLILSFVSWLICYMIYLKISTKNIIFYFNWSYFCKNNTNFNIETCF